MQVKETANELENISVDALTDVTLQCRLVGGKNVLGLLVACRKNTRSPTVHTQQGV